MTNLYVITAYRFNHMERIQRPVDARFLDKKLNSIFYFVDEDGAPADFPHKHLNEFELNPGIVNAGKTHLAEWTFLLTEYQKPFAKYPFFVVSSRFHDKNAKLKPRLSEIWDLAGKGLRKFGWGYLPSYDRPANFQDFKEYFDRGELGMRPEGMALIDQLYGVKIPEDYRYSADFFCNYVGFKSRRHLEQYMKFYMPIFEHFFTPAWEPKIDQELFVTNRHIYQNEKPLTFLLELVSHLFFYKNKLPFAAISYDGLYRIDECSTSFQKILPIETDQKFIWSQEKNTLQFLDIRKI